MKVISEEDLVEVLKNQKNRSAKLISLKARTDARPNKKSRTLPKKTLMEMFGTNSVVKESELSVQINVIYENSVNNRLEKAGEERSFESTGMNYGRFLDGSKCLIEHDGKMKLRVYQTNSTIGKSSRYFKENGAEFTPEEVEVLKEEFLSIKPEEIKSQGLSYQDSCKPTNYNLSNIREISLDGEKYILERN
jgi:hypothetical protein